MGHKKKMPAAMAPKGVIAGWHRNLRRLISSTLVPEGYEEG
jgi:hypothetical protein